MSGTRSLSILGSTGSIGCNTLDVVSRCPEISVFALSAHTNVDLSYAKTRNIPRNRVFKDDAMIELASTKPSTLEDLNKARLLLREARKGDIAEGILSAIKAVNAMDADSYPRLPKVNDKLQVNPALADLLRVLLKAKSERSDVAQKMIASTAELDALAAGQRDVPSLKGWRMDVFGSDALRLCEGKVGLAVKGNKVKLFEL